MTGSYVTLLGTFPPPLGGASKNNQLLYEHLVNLGVPVRKLDVSGTRLAHNRSLSHHLHRISVNLKALFSIAIQRGRVVYVVPDGGLGVWYSLLHLSMCSLRFDKIFIHHRTFRYIEKKSRAMLWIVQGTGRVATHVFLSQGMAERFEDKYGSVQSLICTNARYVREQASIPTARTSGARICLGHISSLCREKGFFDVVETFERVLKGGRDAELHIAGPAIEDEVEDRIDELRSSYPDRVHVYGPLSGETKDAFYRRLDVFLFPTRFAQEAAPNVVYEALAAGVPVIANSRGCIPEIIANSRGTVVKLENDFCSDAAAKIVEMEFNDGARQKRTAQISIWLKLQIDQSESQYRKLIQMLCPDESPEKERAAPHG